MNCNEFLDKLDAYIDDELDPEMAMNLTSIGVQAASILIGTLPILLVYPFAQRYFVHGLTLGSVKG